MAKSTKLGWKKAVEHAGTLITSGELDREEHLKVFRDFLSRPKQQDRRIALGLLYEFIRKYDVDFDRDITLDDLIDIGDKTCRDYWKNFGQYILYPVLRARSVPAEWIDRIADEESAPMRKAFATSLDELAKRKSIPTERTLGIIRYFLDDPDKDVRGILARVLERIGKRKHEQLHYFIHEHEEGAGSHRLELLAKVKGLLGWQT